MSSIRNPLPLSCVLGAGMIATACVQPVSIKPKVSIGSPSSALINSTGSSVFTITYSGAAEITLSDPDVVLKTTGTASCSRTVSGSGNSTRSVTLSGCTGDGTVAIAIAAESASSDNVKADASSDSAAVVVDNTAPGLTITTTAGDPTNVSPIPVNFTFTESVSGFDALDISVAGGSKGALTGSGTDYAMEITPSGVGMVTVSVPGGVATESAGNSSAAAQDLGIEFNNISPTVTISSATVANGAATRSVTVGVKASFSNDVTGFALSDLTVTGGTPANFVALDARTYTFDVTLMNQGLITIDVAAGVAQDSAANSSLAAGQYAFTYDTTAPTAVITSSAGASGSISNSSPIPVTVTFSESVSGFDAADITVTNATKGALSGSGSTYTIDVTPSAQGLVTIDIAAGLVQDSAANGNSAATQFTLTHDSVNPTVALTSLDVPNGGSTNASVRSFTASFSESVTGLAAGEISVSNGTVSNFSGSGTTYTFDVTASSAGSVAVNIAANAAHDSGGNGNSAASQFAYTYDTNPPNTTGGSAGNVSGVGAYSLANDSAVLITFDEGMKASSLTAASLTCGGSVVALSNPVLTNSGATANWTPDEANASFTGSCTLNVSNLEDAAGNFVDSTDVNKTSTITVGL